MTSPLRTTSPRGARVRPGVWGLLAVAVLLSAWALWAPQPPGEPGAPRVVVPVVRLTAAATEPSPGTLPVSVESASPAEPVPPLLGDARSDPFASQPVAPVAPTAPAPVEPAEPVVVPPPAVEYRYLGRFTSPDGETVTLLARGEEAVAVEPGQQLEDGYTVERLDAQGVHLRHPALDVSVIVAIPGTEDDSGPATVAGNPR